MYKKKISWKIIFVLFFLIIISLLCISLIRDVVKIIQKIKENIQIVSNDLSILTAFSFLGKIFLLIIFIGFLLNLQSYFEIHRLKNKLSLWSKLSYYVNQVGEEVFNELPIGIILIDENEKGIQWLNNYANLIFQNPIINTPLKNINTEMEKLIDSPHNKKVIQVGQNKFECFYKKEFNVFYLFNVTEKEQIKNLYYQNTPALSILSFDNLEESLMNYDLSEQTNIQGQYLTIISDFAEHYEGYLKKLFDNRFLLLLKREKLEIMMKNKFDILEKIRNISHKYNLKITLSIGIACWNLSYDKLASYAQNAIELAQKRGGDQAVVNIENENIKFFGAKIDSFIKNSKVNVRVNAQILVDIINQYNNCFIMSHNNSDFDSLGSMIAFYRIACAVNDNKFKSINLIIDEKKLDLSVVPVYRKLIQLVPDIKKNILTTEKAAKIIKKDDFITILDTQLQEITNSPHLLFLTENIVVIDHHRTPNDNIKSNFAYLNSAASSTVELLIELILFLEKEIYFTPFEANVMYAGILLDTNNFTYRTSSLTFEVAAKLKELGADSLEVKSWLRNDFIKILEINKLIDKMEIYMGRFAIIKSEQIYDNRSFLAQVSETVLNIQNIDAAFTFTKLNHNVVGISARSYNNVNVQILMEQLGGGGHLNSAATQIKTDNIEETVIKLKNLLKLEYETGVNMKIILLEDIKNKGSKDDIIEVTSGYGNFLIKNQKALLANNENIDKIKKEKLNKIEEKRKHDFLMSQLKQEIDNKKINIMVKIGPNGKIFGKVTPKEIIEEFENKYNIFIDKKKIHLDSEINSLGIYKIEVKLTKEIIAFFFVHIIDKKNE